MAVLPTPCDPDVAAELLSTHLDQFFATSPHVSDRWTRVETGNPLQAVVGMPSSSTAATYAVLLDATYYDTWPPRVTFVHPEGAGDDLQWVRSRTGNPGFPNLNGTPPFQFALHDTFTNEDGGLTDEQLVCFSYSLDYYFSGHQPAPSERWRPGKTRLDATLNRLFHVLNSPNYYSGGEGSL